jgi:hypothetical protein
MLITIERIRVACDVEYCKSRCEFAAANLDIVRAEAAKIGWGSGVVDGVDAFDLCPTHMERSRRTNIVGTLRLFRSATGDVGWYWPQLPDGAAPPRLIAVDRLATFEGRIVPGDRPIGEGWTEIDPDTHDDEDPR